MSASNVIGKAFAAYRAWGLYLVCLTTVFYALVGVVAFFLHGALGPTAVQALLAVAGPWALALTVDAIAAIEEPDADRTLVGRFAAIGPYFATVTVVWIFYALLVGFGLVFLILPGLIFLTWWALVVPVVVLERTGVGAAFSRSKSLVSGRAMTVFWTLLMAGVISLLPAFAFGFVLGSAGVAELTEGMELVVNLVSGGLVTPFVALCLVILYADLRGGSRAF